MADKRFSEAEERIRAWLQAAGLQVQALPAVPGLEIVWGISASDDLGPVAIWQKASQPHSVFVVGRVEIETGDIEAISSLPNAFFYDLELGLAFVGMDPIGYVMRPLRAVNFGTPFYFEDATSAGLLAAINRVRHAGTYLHLLIRKALEAPIPTEPAHKESGPTN